MIKNIEYIIEYVAKAFRVTVEQVKGKSRKGEIVRARQASQYLTKKFLDVSKQDIGWYFNSDHSTVIHSIEVYVDFIFPKYKTLCNEIERHLKDIYGDVDYVKRNAKSKIALRTAMLKHQRELRKLERQVSEYRNAKFKPVYINGEEQLAKTCIKCNTTKAVPEFAGSKRCIMGVRGVCKTCINEQKKLWMREKRNRLKNNLQKAA